jgi:hypothetical protein
MHRSASATAERTAPWPHLDDALHRDRRRRRTSRTAAGLAVAALVSAAVLPFTPVRVEPLDAVAAALGLRSGDGPPDRRSDGLIQPEVPLADQDVHVDGAALPVPRGAPVEDDAWLAAAAQRARALVVADRTREDDTAATIWARDDGTTARVVVGFYPPGDPDRERPRSLATLAGPSGGEASALELSSTSAGLRSREPENRSVAPGLVAVSEPDATAVEVAGLPSVSAAGIRTSTWHALAKAGGGLWIGDLGTEGVYGYEYRFTVEGKRGGRAWWNDVVIDDSADTTGLSAAEQFVHDSPLAALGRVGFVGGSWADIPFSEGAHARIVAFRSPGGGWLVTGDLWVPDEAGRNTTEKDGTVSGALKRIPFPLVPAPATTSGGTPFVGLTAADLSSFAGPYVFVWAPPEVLTVEAGPRAERAWDGFTMVEVFLDGKRHDGADPAEPILVEGLGGNGQVIARTWVRPPTS